MMNINRQSEAEKKVAELYADVTRRAGALSFGSCPIELTAAFVRLCLAQSCGKCVPCRVGLSRLVELLEQVLDGVAGIHALPCQGRQEPEIGCGIERLRVLRHDGRGEESGQADP